MLETLLLLKTMKPAMAAVAAMTEHTEIFSMNDAKKFLENCAAKNSSVTQIAIDIKPKGESFEVYMLALNSENKVVHKEQDLPLCRKLIANRIYTDVKKFMNGEITQYLSIKDCLDI